MLGDVLRNNIVHDFAKVMGEVIFVFGVVVMLVIMFMWFVMIMLCLSGNFLFGKGRGLLGVYFGLGWAYFLSGLWQRR